MSENHTRQGLGNWLDQHPELSLLFAKFQHSFDTLPQLPPSVLPLCKIRMQQLHGLCPISTGSDKQAEFADAVSRWPDSTQFSDAEKACLAFTEVYAIDVHAISDAQANAVKQHFGEPGLVALVQALGVFYGMSRLSQLWRTDADLNTSELLP